MKIRTGDLSGIALDLAVAKVEGYSPEKHPHPHGLVKSLNC